MNINEHKVQAEKSVHDIIIMMRKEMKVSGVKDVVSFDESGVFLKTVCGDMTVEGRGLKVGTLDTDQGIVHLEGQIDAIYYSNEASEEKRGLLSKLFK